MQQGFTEANQHRRRGRQQALGPQVVIRQAAAEADHQLAHYYYSQRIDLVAAADGDYLIHGCNMLRLTVRAVE